MRGTMAVVVPVMVAVLTAMTVVVCAMRGTMWVVVFAAHRRCARHSEQHRHRDRLNPVENHRSKNRTVELLPLTNEPPIRTSGQLRGSVLIIRTALSRLALGGAPTGFFVSARPSGRRRIRSRTIAPDGCVARWEHARSTHGDRWLEPRRSHPGCSPARTRK
jgi:hypothetical protein